MQTVAVCVCCSVCVRKSRQAKTSDVWHAGSVAFVLQCVAVCCSVLQFVAVCISVMHCVAVCCSVYQRDAGCCSVCVCTRDMRALNVWLPHSYV